MQCKTNWLLANFKLIYAVLPKQKRHLNWARVYGDAVQRGEPGVIDDWADDLDSRRDGCDDAGYDARG